MKIDVAGLDKFVYDKSSYSKYTSVDKAVSSKAQLKPLKI